MLTEYKLLVDIIGGVFCGGVAGYATNDFALWYLFSKHGVILKQRKELAQNIGGLIEKSVITPEILKAKLSDENFKHEILNVVTSMLKIIECSEGGKPLNEVLKTSDATLKESLVFLRNNIDGLIEKIALAVEDIPAGEVINEARFSFIVSRISYEFNKSIKPNFIKFLSINFRNCFHDDMLVDILGLNVLTSIRINICDFYKQTITSLLKNELSSNLDNTLLNIGRELSFEEAMQTLIKSLKKEVIDGVNSADEINKLLFFGIERYLDTNDGKVALENVICEIIKILKDIDIPVKRIILVNNLREGLAKLVEEEENEIIDRLLGFIKSKKAYIEQYLTKTIDDQIGSEKDDGGIRAWLKDAFYNNFYDKEKKADNYFTEILGKLESITNIEELKDGVTKLVDVLDTKTVGEVIGWFDESGLLHKVLADYIKSSISDLKVSGLKIFTNEELASFIKELELPKYDISKLAADFIKNNYILKNSFAEDTCGKISEYIESLSSKKAGEFLSADESGFLYKLLFDKVKADEICEYIYKEIKDEKVAKLAHVSEDVLRNKIETLTFEKLEKEKENILSTEFGNYIGKVRIKLGELRDYIAERISGFEEKFFNGFVTSVSSESIDSLSDDELLQTTKGFMGGRDLNKITILGALIGAIVGAGVGVFTVFSGYIPVLSGFEGIPLGGQIAIYAMIGFLTNILAVFMIFKPYRKHMFFPQGVIPKNKSNFANVTGDLISEKLINTKTSRDYIDKNNDEFINAIKNNVDIAVLIKNLINDNADSISKYVIENLNIKEPLNQFINEASEKTLDSLLNEKVIKYFSLLAKDKALEFKFDEIIKNHFVNKQAAFIEIAPALASNENFNKIINGVSERIILNLGTLASSSNFIPLLVAPRLQGMIDEVKGKSIAEIFPRFIESKLDFHVSNYMDKGLDALSKKMQELIKTYFAPDKKFKDILSNQAGTAMKKNLANMVNGLINVLDDEFNKKKKTYADAIVQEECGFFSNLLYDKEKTVRGVINQISLKYVLNDNKSELVGVVSAFFDNIFADKRLADIGFETTEDFSGSLDDFLKSAKVRSVIYNILNNSAKVVAGNVKLADVLILLEADNAERLLYRYSKSIDAGKGVILQSLRNNEQRIICEFSQFLKAAALHYSKNTKVADIFAISAAEVNEVSKRIQSKIKNTPVITNPVFELLTMFKSELGQITVGKFVEMDKLNNDISRLFDKIKGEQTESISKELNNIIYKFVNEFEAIVRPRFLDEAKNLLAYNFLNSIFSNIGPLLKYLNITETAKEQLGKLEASEIHKMFDSFAKGFFWRLKLYGFFGGIYGITAYYLNLILSGATVVFLFGKGIYNGRQGKKELK